ncbi:MAG TPA: VCBS repeat-containing protein, partial [Planctomycetota bacterium]|nr:VCBS repeat-containing protein [Planctomycetota bacterium]
MSNRRRRRLETAAAAVAWLAAAGCDGEAPRDVGGREAGAAASRPAAGRRLVEVGDAAGVTAIVRSGEETQRHIPEVKATGVAVFDYDGDDRLDLLFTGGSTLKRFAAGEPGFGCTLYRNETPPGGPLRFVDVTERAKLPAARWPGGPCVVDYDADGDLDVLLTGFGGLALWRNRGDGTFEDATKAARLAVGGWSSGAACADFDGDGDLDVYVARYLRFDVANPPVHGARFTCLWKGREVLCGPRGLPPEPDVVLRNDGDGGFTDVTTAWGFDRAAPQYGLGVLVDDFDRDGRPDVFVANDSGPSFLWWNRGGTSFVEGGFEAGVAYGEDGGETAGMGVDSADLNGDGVPDLVVTNFEAQPNSLFISRGERLWLESSRAFGVALPSLPDLGWGC